MGSELLCKRGCYGSTELSIVAPSDAGANFFCNRPRCFRNSPAPRSALRPKRVSLRATQGFAPTGVRELIHQEVGPNGKIKRGQIKLTESYGECGSRSTAHRAGVFARMIGLPVGTKIWIAAGVTDLRRGFTGFVGIVQKSLEEN